MIKLFSLGDLYVSDFLEESELPRGDKVEMNLLLDESTGLVRLEKMAPKNTMYGKYWYRSGINSSMRNELHSIVESILSLYKFSENDVWVDIACNDGTLLSYVPKEFIRLGIDPADDSYTTSSKNHAEEIVQDYFSVDAYRRSRFGKQPAKVVTSIAMFYDLEDPESFIKDVYEVMDDDGIWVLQLSYTPLMLQQLAFDNICHEHIFYYSLFNIKTMLEKHGLKIMDVQLNDTNGGSFRVYVMKNCGDHTKFSSQPYRDVCSFRVQSLLQYEHTLRLDHQQTWTDFYTRINSLKEKVVSFIQQEKNKGKSVWGYGASTKGNTLLQYFGLDHTLIDGIAERSTHKYGLRTVGTNIPIYSEAEMRKIKPDYLLVLPWHFINEFMQRERDYLASGGKFIVPCPDFKVMGMVDS
jgi:hypothetical protein